MFFFFCRNLAEKAIISRDGCVLLRKVLLQAHKRGLACKPEILVAIPPTIYRAPEPELPKTAVETAEETAGETRSVQGVTKRCFLNGVFQSGVFRKRPGSVRAEGTKMPPNTGVLGHSLAF